MPPKPQTDLIREQGDRITTLVERVDHFRRDFDRLEGISSETKLLLYDIDKRLAIAVRDVERLEKKVDDLLGRKWELWKIVLAAFLGSVLTVAVSRSFDLLLPVGLNRTNR